MLKHFNTWWSDEIHGEIIKYMVVVAFCLYARIMGEVQWVVPLPVLFFFFFGVEISSQTPIPLFRLRSVHSGSASWDHWGQVFPVQLHGSSFPWEVTVLCLDSTLSPLQLCCFKGVCLFSCNQPPALLEEWPGSFMCHCSRCGMDTG